MTDDDLDYDDDTGEQELPDPSPWWQRWAVLRWLVWGLPGRIRGWKAWWRDRQLQRYRAFRKKHGQIRTWYVLEDAGEPQDGSREHPFSTLGRAAQVADCDDTIEIGPGTYKEQWVRTRVGVSIVAKGSRDLALDRCDLGGPLVIDLPEGSSTVTNTRVHGDVTGRAASFTSAHNFYRNEPEVKSC
jgi:hypothetical protein